MNDTPVKFEVFPWNENFETGIAPIDEQHKILIAMLNELASTLANDDSIEINRVFKELTEYAEFHFEYEEAIWIEYLGNDSWLSSHQLNHSTFLPRITELKDKKTDKYQSEVIESIILFLIRWLAFHILDSDKRMAFFIENIHKGMSFDEAKIAAERKMGGSFKVLVETIMSMYDSLSSRTLTLMRESNYRRKIENELHIANKKLRQANARLESLSITDALTGLHNRRHLKSVFLREIKRARREKFSLALLIIDIDFFKKINDHYGHTEGDRILVQVSETLRKNCQRPNDYAFRLGGEEFCVITSSLCLQDTIKFAEIFRTAVENLKIPLEPDTTTQCLTVSIGSCTRMPGETDTIDSYMSIADKNLYQAKASGRNQSIASP
ncbi:MAG: GGDEF domain-containing protein [Nitrosomonas sp.]|nr:GGDEF domain-containing protein [Nitrosomonas sp.]